MKNQVENRRESNKTVWMIDTTLRDGEQAPGIVFSQEEKVRIASMLVDAGIDEVEAGIPVMGETECDTIRLLKGVLPSVRLTSWCRLSLKDMKAADSCNTGSIHFSFPVSSILLKAFHRNEEWVRKQMEIIIPEAKKYFDHISVGAQDATRCDIRQLQTMIKIAGECGVERFRIADTVGIATPMEIHNLFKTLLEKNSKTILEFHGHNDLGMATANTISAVSSGAKAVSVTVNGLGERAGNACLEEVAAALYTAMGFTSNISFDHLQKVCHYLADITQRPIPLDKPVTGTNIFTHESGIHCRALMDDQNTYQSLSPKTIGRGPMRFEVGKTSGTSLVKHILKKCGVDADMDVSYKMIPFIQQAVMKKRRNLTTQEVKKIWKNQIC